MKVFETYIDNSLFDLLEQSRELPLEKINLKFKSICGINAFFETQFEFRNFLEIIKNDKSIKDNSNRIEYGDFQTNLDLSNEICLLLKKQNITPEVIIEPTCGTGSFIISCLNTFKDIKYIFAGEIYKPYVWATKFAILNFYLVNQVANKPEITIEHYNIFNYQFNDLSKKFKNRKILIIGNPPWVTNSKLSVLDSGNLPKKSNFKNHTGLDAITGKGNFDIGEFISLKLINEFSKLSGYFAFLVKNSVVKNILLEQKRVNYSIANIRQYDIDAKKEFNVSVNASLFTCSLNQQAEYDINEYDFYSRKFIRKYGWLNDKFVSDIELYLKSKNIEGAFPFIWRQGVKHDASKIMELEKINGCYINNNKETVEIESDLVFPLLKSSDLKDSIVEVSRKFIIITQEKIGQDTSYISTEFPNTYRYLQKNIKYFDKRESSIYRGKPPFSIFGIGDYSFKPYKVAISGMYKKTLFTIVKPSANKPILLDDTCYFIGFDNFIEAAITAYLLNTSIVQSFIKSIAFRDAKRMITKELLMRINLNEVVKNTDYDELEKKIKDISIDDWKNYKTKLLSIDFNNNRQLNVFENSTQ